MDKKTGMIISIVGSVVCLCLAIACCSTGIYGGVSIESEPNVLYIVLGVCAGIVPIIVAVLLWVFLVIRAKDESVEAAPEMDV